MQDKALAMLGMATKAGKVVSGEFSVEKAVKEGKAWLVLVAEDASDNTKKSFTNMCEFYECDLVFYGKKENLGSMQSAKSSGHPLRSQMKIWHRL